MNSVVQERAISGADRSRIETARGARHHPGGRGRLRGGGGKSGAILTVSNGLQQAGMKVLVAPTTKMTLGEANNIGPLVTSEVAGELREKAEKALSGSP